MLGWCWFSLWVQVVCASVRVNAGYDAFRKKKGRVKSSKSILEEEYPVPSLHSVTVEDINSFGCCC